ncbi:MAG: 4-hydroxybenzoyl-CoA thioesterase [Thiotrichales bacterium]|nr:MAG: 4-hydroxybenzoyl-CoA thioesterase [Thiotrichales bacterium]
MQAFKVEFEVRDSELDMQGIVNNSNYLKYFEHTRHKFLQHHGISFAEVTKQKQYLILTSTTLNFKKPLRSLDKFYVTCQLQAQGRIRVTFLQNIYLLADDTLTTTSQSTATCIDGNTNKPYIPEWITCLY